jgi:hypothetical protein
VTDWRGLLPLCPNCAAAAIMPRPRISAGAPPLRPDRDATFALDTRSPLAYELRPVAVQREHEDAVAADRVMVVARTAAGVATIRRFALNTPFHVEPTRDALRLPAGTTLGEIEAYDPRLARRTASWHHAHHAAAALHAARPEARDAVLQTISWTVSFEGFWSVWATVLWERLRDEAVLDALRRHPDLPATRAL